MAQISDCFSRSYPSSICCITFRKDELRLIIGVEHAVEKRRDALDIGFSLLSNRGSIDNGIGCLMISP